MHSTTLEKQIGTGFIDEGQLSWLDAQLERLAGKFVMVMVHHNVLEHLPGQSKSALGQRYMIQNAPELVARLQSAKVPVAFYRASTRTRYCQVR